MSATPSSSSGRSRPDASWTVTAFANGEGGVLLFGVEDDGEMIGVPSNEVRAVIDRLTNVIRDTVRPLPAFRAEIIEAAGRSIIALAVEPGERLPYGVGADSRDVRYYVRRAASTFPASPTTCARLSKHASLKPLSCSRRGESDRLDISFGIGQSAQCRANSDGHRVPDTGAGC